jgi:hypothetical protein
VSRRGILSEHTTIFDIARRRACPSHVSARSAAARRSAAETRERVWPWSPVQLPSHLVATGLTRKKTHTWAHHPADRNPFYSKMCVACSWRAERLNHRPAVSGSPRHHAHPDFMDQLIARRWTGRSSPAT